VSVIKFPGSARDVLNQLERVYPFEELITGSRVVLMHTRAATVGDPLENKNNHPFETKDIVMAHNGSLWYYYTFSGAGKAVNNSKWNRDYVETLNVDLYEIFGHGDYDIPETDSFTLAYEIQTWLNKGHTLIEAVKMTFEDFCDYGSSAVWVWHKEKELLALYKDTNPLFFGYKGDKLYFASEAWMLKDLGVKKWHSLSRGEIRVYSADGFVASSEVEEARRGYGYSRGKVVYYDDYEEDDDKDKRRFAKYVWDFWGW